MEQAIKKAIEGGWKVPHVETLDELPSAIRFYTKDWQKVVCNPAFWQALGKAMEWNKETVSYKIRAKEYTIVNHNGIIKRGAHTIVRPRWKKNSRPWLSHWHDFIDHLIAGKDAESFFKDLIK